MASFSRRALSVAVSLAMVSIALLGVAGPASADGVAVDPTEIHGGYYPNTFFAGADADAMAAATGGHRASLLGTFMDTTLDAGVEAHIPGKWNNDIEGLNEIWKGHGTPLINVRAGAASTTDIISGSYDASITQWASYMKRWLGGENLTLDPLPASAVGRSMIIAPMQEMNWTGGLGYQCQPATYAAAYRHFVDVAEAELGPAADQVRWMFAPNGATAVGCGKVADYYPGNAYADFGGVSAYNWYGISGPSLPVSQVIDWALDEIRPFMPAKPMIVAQTATCSVTPGRDAWIQDVFDFVEADANAVGFVWFNLDNWWECDWRIWDGATAATGWTAGLSGAEYAWPLADWFVPGTTLAMAGTPNPCVGIDCDSVNLADAGGQFHMLDELTNAYTDTAYFFGNPGDYPLTGDWDCDGEETPGQYRQSDGFVYLRNSNNSGIADRQFFLGDPGDVPLTGDFNNDGCDTVSIYRPPEAKFYIANSLAADFAGISADYSFYFGDTGDKPFTGDFDGDGISTVGLHREATGRVYFRNSNKTGVADADFIFGDPGDKLIAGDWDGDGDDSVAVYRPSNGFFYGKLDNTAGVADAAFFVGFGFVGLGIGPG
ncbi:MAG: hypothetical protein V3R84_00500 [Acidimicrobiia bacterium]